METRSAPRINVSLKLISEVDKNSEQNVALAAGNAFEGNIFDISLVGVGAFIKYFLPKGSVINMKMDGAPFGLKETMVLKGEVRHCGYVKSGQYRCGIKFLNLSEEYLQAISKFIATYEKRKTPRLGL